jgi:hypothetical protein
MIRRVKSNKCNRESPRVRRDAKVIFENGL